MTNTIAVALGLFLFTALAVDVVFFGTGHVLFLSKKLFELIEWLAFWR
ncbi:hypothetical protein KUV57_06975 [Epibacterium sp. DP7N7-1]|nr:hypothetical protein [Tritonibacter mobilis]MBW3242436.1 hypothetical protein [Epibacterium sp. DP7N7-1]